MKVKKFVRWILEISLIFGMAACSPEQSEKTNDSVGGSPENENTANQNPTGTEGPESTESGMQYVYSGKIVDLAEGGAGILSGSDVVVHDMAGRGNQVYVLLEVREWGEEPADYTQKAEYTSYYQVFSCMADGSEMAVSGHISLPAGGGYVNDLHLSDDGCVAALLYSRGQ